MLKRGLPHIAFRRDYLANQCGFVSQVASLPQGKMASPVWPSPGSMRDAHSSANESKSPRKTRRGRRRIRPIRILQESSGGDPPT